MPWTKSVTGYGRGDIWRQMMAFKIAGAVMIICASALIGKHVVCCLSKRIVLLSALRDSMRKLESFINYERLPLTEAMRRVSADTDKEIEKFFECVIEILEDYDGVSVSESVRKASEESLSELAECDRRSIERLGNSLGMLDAEMQKNVFERYIQDSDYRIKTLTDELKQKENLYVKAGVLTGLFLVLVII